MRKPSQQRRDGRYGRKDQVKLLGPNSKEVGRDRKKRLTSALEWSRDVRNDHAEFEGGMEWP